MILPTTANSSMLYGAIPPQGLSQQLSAVESSHLNTMNNNSNHMHGSNNGNITPNANGAMTGDFLSQLGKTWNLIQSKAQELDSAKRKHRRTEKSLSEVQSEVEALRAKESNAAAKVAELESGSLVLTSENSRLKKEIKEQKEAVLFNTDKMNRIEKELHIKVEEEQRLNNKCQETRRTNEALKRARDQAEEHANEMESRLNRLKQKVTSLEHDSESNMRQVENQVAEVHREKNELSTHLWHVMEELKTSERRNVELEGKQYRQTKD
jgi:chromosome segregation ATPase